MAIASAAGPSLVAEEPALAQPNIASWPLPETVSPEGRAMASALARAPQPDPLPPIAAQRQFIDTLQQSMGAALRERYQVRVEQTAIAGVPVRIAYPPGVTGIASGPVLLNLHGGGFQLDSGSLTESIPIAALSGLPVVAVLYRLAPENPHPAALEDALAVYEALRKDREASRIAVYGTSAGAGLGAQLVGRLTTLSKPVPAALGFFSGSADLTKSGDSESWMPLPGAAKSLRASLASYIGNSNPADPALSPLHGDLARFPPTLLVSSTRDILLSQTAIFGKALLQNGVDARLIVFDGLPHAFWAYMPIPETDEANQLMARFLRQHLR